MKNVLILTLGLLASCSTNAYDQSPAKLLQWVKVCENFQIPEYGMIERPASDSEVFTGFLLGGVIGNQFGSGSGKDAMTVLGALNGASKGGQRKRERVIIGYTTERRCWGEYQ